MTTVGLVYSRLREEEKLLLAAAEREGIRVVPQNDSEIVLGLDAGDGVQGDVIVSRSVSTTRGLALLRALDAWGVPAVNRLAVAAACADKAETSWRLRRAGVPTPETRVAFDTASALAAFESIGYPAVLKPVQGSWARLIARADSRREAEQLLEHRAMLPNPLHHIYYIQEYVDKPSPPVAGGTGGPGFHDARATARATSGAPGESTEVPAYRDLRAFVIGDETVGAIWRESPHWITNTARGAKASALAVDDDLGDLCLRAAEAVGGGVLAIDLMPTQDGWTVHEVNHTMEFRNSIQPTGVDIPARILRYAVEEARA